MKKYATKGKKAKAAELKQLKEKFQERKLRKKTQKNERNVERTDIREKMLIDRKEKLGIGKSTHPKCAKDSNREERLENASKSKDAQSVVVMEHSAPSGAP